MMKRIGCGAIAALAARLFDPHDVSGFWVLSFRLPDGSYAFEKWCDASDPTEQESITPPEQQ